MTLPAEAAYNDCNMSGYWGAWMHADFGNFHLYCEETNVKAYASVADNRTSSISNRRSYYVDFYADPNYKGPMLYMPANFSHNNLTKQGWNDRISSTELR
jgi:hypothetical protein